MNKGIKIFLSTLIVLTLLIVLHSLFGLFTPYNYITARFDIMKNTPRLVIYGEPGQTDKQAIFMASKYGFKYELVGCSLSTSAVNGIDNYNAVITNHLNSKLGLGWKDDFYDKVDSLFRIERMDTIRKIVFALPEVIEIKDALDSISKGKRHLNVWVYPRKKNNSNVWVGESEPNNPIVVFYYFNVDPYSLEVDKVQY